MKSFRIALILSTLGAISPAFAGIYTDDLSRCLVEKSSTDDKTVLLQWIFVAMAQHPSVSALTKITPDDVDKHNQAAGGLFMRLLTETCVDSTKKAVKFEGAASIQLAFQVLGQAAAGELFTHPNVAKMMSGLDKFLDKEKLEALTK